MSNGFTRRAAMSGLVGTTVAPHALADRLARTTALGASNFFGAARYGSIVAAIAAGEAATGIGEIFSVSDALGNLIFRERVPVGSIEVARTVTPTSLSGQSGAGMSGYAQGEAFSPGTVGHRLARSVMITDAPFNALGDGNPANAVTNSEAVVAAAHAVGVGGTLIVPDGVFVLNPVDISGVHLTGSGTLRSTPASEEMPFVTANGSRISGITIDAPSYTLYGIIAGGASPRVENVVFTGSYGHCAFFQNAIQPALIGCRLPEGGSHITPFVFEGCKKPRAVSNDISEHTGFGIQFRWSTDCMANNNSIAQRVFRQNFTAKREKQSFDFTPDRTCMRFSVSVNGIFKLFTVTIKDKLANYRIALSNLSIGDKIVIYGFVGLESIQFNSGCDGIEAVGNSVTNGGDSAIVVASDYHFNGMAWVLDAGAVVESDWPKNGIISSNKVRGPIHAAGISLLHAKNVVVGPNSISDCGYIHDSAFRCGVALNLIKNCNIFGNSYEDVNGQGMSAVMYTGGGVDRSNSFGYNKGIGCPNFNASAGTNPAERRVGYTFTSASIDARLTQQLQAMLAGPWTGGAYTAADFAITTFGGTGIGTECETTYACSKALKTYPGEFADFTIAAKSRGLLIDRFVQVRFYGAGHGYVQMFYEPPGDDAEPRWEIRIDSADHREYEATMAIGKVENFALRIGSTVGKSAIISDLEWNILRV